MHHLAAYSEAIDNTTNNDVNALTDDVLVIQNNHFLPQFDMSLVAAAVMSATLSRARLNSASLRLISPPFIRPVIVAAVPGDSRNVSDYRSNPFRVRGLEELALEATSGVAMTERFNGLIWLMDSFDPAPRGDIYTLRGTSTTASVASTWTTLVTTWADTLPAGQYAVVGFSGFAATAIAFRLILPGQLWRPGAMVGDSAGDQIHEMFRLGGLGTWGRFTSTAMPQVQALNNAAVSTHEYFMDLVKIG